MQMKSLKRIWLKITLRPLIYIVFFFIFGVWVGRSIRSNNIGDVGNGNILIPQTPAQVTMSHIHEFDGSHDTIEKQMESTLRNCLGPKCFNQLVTVVTPSNHPINNIQKSQSQPQSNQINRIGLLSLPQSGGEVLFELLSIFNSINSNSNSNNVKIEIIPEKHVPAYGYGKNHGWSSIIRLSRRVIHHAYALVKKNNIIAHDRAGVENDLSKTMLRQDDSNDAADVFRSQITQVTIFQCRNSHVAAHTRMLTVHVDQLYSRPLLELDKILTFIGVEYDRNELIAKVASTQFQYKLKESFYEIIVPQEYYQIGLHALKYELDITNSMTNWPCKSFKKDVKKFQKLPIQPYEINPNCTAPYVKCSVPFDLQEMK